jgi:hypothetical protein
MPCCAFAAFILSQVVLGFGALKRFVLRSDGAFDDAPSNSATESRLIGGAPALAEPSRRRYGWRMLTIAASVEILIANRRRIRLPPARSPSSTQDIRVERLRPGSKYAMRNGSEHAFTADNSGAASLFVELRGRTPIHIVPAN